MSDGGEGLELSRELDIGSQQADSVAVSDKNGQIVCGTNTGVKLFALGEKCALGAVEYA